MAGVQVAEKIFRLVEPDVHFHQHKQDGQHMRNGETAFAVEASIHTILSCERLVLNCMQRMSGIATMTSVFVAAVEEYGTKILDTRKTVPGLRLLDKYAVKAGGGTNHRIGLYDMVLIKDNHIKVAEGIGNAVAEVRKHITPAIKIEVETTTVDEVKQALEAGADIIMLDNMTTPTMRECVKLINGRAKVEASGNMTIERIREVAATGVDYISIGALTHSVTALDISMNIETAAH